MQKRAHCFSWCALWALLFVASLFLVETNALSAEPFSPVVSEVPGFLSDVQADVSTSSSNFSLDLESNLIQASTLDNIASAGSPPANPNPPQFASALTTGSPSKRTITFFFTTGGGGATYYRTYYKQSGSEGWTFVAPQFPAAGQTTYYRDVYAEGDNTGILPGYSYQFFIRACNDYGCADSTPSDSMRAEDLDCSSPPTPTGLDSSPCQNSNPVWPATCSFSCECPYSGSGTLTCTLSATWTTSGGCSQGPPCKPGTPQFDSAGATYINFHFDAPSGGGVTSYSPTVYSSDGDSQDFASFSSSDSVVYGSVQNGFLSAGNTYQIEVQACNSAGCTASDLSGYMQTQPDDVEFYSGHQTLKHYSPLAAAFRD